MVDRGGNDVIFAGFGDDTVEVSGGRDQIVLGPGADLISILGDAGVAPVRDVNTREDQIAVSGPDIITDPATLVLQDGETAPKADERFYLYDNGNLTYRDGGEETLIARLLNVSDAAAVDFFLI
ncbi:MAG: hypothetical protein AAGF49_16420 [Pseudomonadota bacterium]